jgi:hypothetical protein
MGLVVLFQISLLSPNKTTRFGRMEKWDEQTIQDNQANTGFLLAHNKVQV